MGARTQGRRWPADRALTDGEGTQPGDFQFQDLSYEPTDTPCKGADKAGRLAYACPRTGEPCGEIIIGDRHKPDRGSPTWQWDGNLESPTLTPSINCRGGLWLAWLAARRRVRGVLT